MLHKLRSFSFFDALKHTSIYFLATILVQGLGIVSLPVFTYFMDGAEYGIANVYLSYVLVGAVLLSFNLHWSLARHYYESPDTFKAFFSTIFVAVTAIYAFFALIIYAFASPIADAINLPVSTIGWMLVFIYTTILWGIFQQVGIAQKFSRQVTITQVVLHYLKFGVTVLCFFFMTVPAFMGKIIGEWIAATIVSLYLLWQLRQYWELKTWEWAHLRYALTYSLPLIPYALGGYILASFDQWYINAYIGNDEAGLYSFAYKLGTLLLGLVTSLQSATEPDYYRQMNEKRYDDTRRQVLTAMRILLLGAVFLILFSLDMGALLSAKASFRASLHLVPPIVGGYVFYGLAVFHTRGINYIKKNLYLTVIVIFASILNIVLNAIYIPDYGYVAAAYTTLVAYIAMAAVAVLVTTYWLRLPALPLAAIGLYGIFSGAVIAVYYLLNLHLQALQWGALLIKLGLFALTAVVLFWGLLRRLIR